MEEEALQGEPSTPINKPYELTYHIHHTRPPHLTPYIGRSLQ
jgi:hypothetical protein